VVRLEAIERAAISSAGAIVRGLGSAQVSNLYGQQVSVSVKTCPGMTVQGC
jgi:hypothetical protein